MDTYKINDVIVVSQSGAIVTLTIDRPKALNAINHDVMSGLNRWFGAQYQDHGQISGVIIIGSGDKAFVAGADIKGFGGLTAETGMKMSKYGQDTYFLIENFHKPVIAAVNGFALGGGCELAMACHMRIATDSAKFGQPEVNLGLIPGYGGTQRLPQLIGKAKAMELTLTGDMIGAEEAEKLGLVNHVTTLKDLIPTCETILNKIYRKGPLAVDKSIKAINAYYSAEDGYMIEHKTFGELLVGDECKEGVAAFLEKRKPEF